MLYLQKVFLSAEEKNHYQSKSVGLIKQVYYTKKPSEISTSGKSF